ncbi:glycosyltransferase family 4 protein [Novosphingobium panipatense]|uniref:Glycosyltransferase involved in cell wall bisynthesis n=1 Tax=Novosphingobium panipatense TaxID=428991 RepID=A0ABY1PZN8_9SPHN|nr:glycosyltransferase family 4 protein [Novosphingobium panipatense]SMP52828.1 Glycosyltransferase involved in cell wall bisynthesis [Novosphingobium panipatense]
MSGAGLRALITVDAVGGVWQYGLDLASGLAARGVEPVLAVMGPKPDAAQREEAHRIDGVTIVETGLPLDWLSDSADPILAAGRMLAEFAGDIAADIVQLNMPTLAAAPPPPVPVVAVTHGCVATWWEAAKPGEALGTDYHWHRDLMAQGLRAADRVVAPSASYARTIARYYALDQAPVVVHNGRTPIAAPTEGPFPDRALTVGRLWDSVKCAGMLDRVAARIHVPFSAAGNPVGPHGERVELHHLNLLGQLDAVQLGRELAARPIFVSAASFEPFGLAVLEAAQAGCPLVLSDIDTFRELWDGAACFVPAGDEIALERAITGLVEDEALRLRLSEAARKRAAQYAPRKMADSMLAIYREALASSPAAGRVAA